MNRQTAVALAEALGLDHSLESSGKLLGAFVSNLESELRVLTEALFDESETERIDVYVALRQLTKRVEAVGPLAEYVGRTDPSDATLPNDVNELAELASQCADVDELARALGVTVKEIPWTHEQPLHYMIDAEGKRCFYTAHMGDPVAACVAWWSHRIFTPMKAAACVSTARTLEFKRAESEAAE